jgi:DNA topoisomerase-1
MVRMLGEENVKSCSLIVAEKPSAARRIAEALDREHKPKVCQVFGVTYFVADRDRKLVVVSALGHLYTVAQRKGRSTQYPVFDFVWKPRYLVNRRDKRVKAYIETIAKLSLEADTFIDACDYDVEGSLIGFNILKYVCRKADTAKRMKYSTLTDVDLVEAYKNLLPALDFKQIEAGISRHEIDWLYGINLSRALNGAVKRVSQRYPALSIGRVQGPALRFIVQREVDIECFVPTPYWTINGEVEIDGELFEVKYERGKVKNKVEALQIAESCQAKSGKVSSIERKTASQLPPTPFNLSALQREAFRLFRFSPKYTVDVAEQLYLDALISYPRTGSQKLPSVINYRAVLQGLAQQPRYSKFCIELLESKKLKPREGEKVDPAHPAIYPTGNKPKRQLKTAEGKLFDLIVKRFLTVFAGPARKETSKILINISGYVFLLIGSRILEEGWIRFYKPYFYAKQAVLPNVGEGEEVIVKQVIFEEKFTPPPPRYNTMTLLRKMEEENIGTKATRGETIQTLLKRRYITGKDLKVTTLGSCLMKILEKYASRIVSVALTRELEEMMQRIEQGEISRGDVLEETVGLLKPVLDELQGKEEVIGMVLNKALNELILEERVVGTCPACKSNLVILRSRQTSKRFVGCMGYFKGICKTSYPLPQNGLIKPSKRPCSSCGSPIVTLIRKRRRPWRFCVNPECPEKMKKEQL